jgi:hypothetical protein
MMHVIFETDLVVRWAGPDGKGEGEDVLASPLVARVITDHTPSELIEIPAGFRTDGGSIPWGARLLIDPTHTRRAFVLHDWAYAEGRDDHAELFDAALRADRCRPWLRWLMTVAVRLRPALRKG